MVCAVGDYLPSNILITFVFFSIYTLCFIATNTIFNTAHCSIVSKYSSDNAVYLL